MPTFAVNVLVGTLATVERVESFGAGAAFEAFPVPSLWGWVLLERVNEETPGVPWWMPSHRYGKTIKKKGARDKAEMLGAFQVQRKVAIRAYLYSKCLYPARRSEASSLAIYCIAYSGSSPCAKPEDHRASKVNIQSTALYSHYLSRLFIRARMRCTRRKLFYCNYNLRLYIYTFCNENILRQSRESGY